MSETGTFWERVTVSVIAAIVFGLFFGPIGVLAGVFIGILAP